MDKPISVGDLVVVVMASPCPIGGERALGLTFIVRSIVNEDSTPFPWCAHCGGKHEYRGKLVAEVNPDKWIHIYRLKRIPPLADLDGLESEEVDKLPSPRLIEAAKRYKRLVTSK